MRSGVGLAAVVSLVAVALPSQAGPLDQRILAVGFRYQPEEVTLAEGEPLEFTNLDIAPHDVTALETGPDGLPLFRTDTIGTGSVVTVDLEDVAPGVYDFTCTLHPEMLGTLYLESADG